MSQRPSHNTSSAADVDACLLQLSICVVITERRRNCGGLSKMTERSEMPERLHGNTSDGRSRGAYEAIIEFLEHY